MKSLVFRVGVCMLLLGLCPFARADGENGAACAKDQILSLMTKACDWQLAELPDEKVRPNDTNDNWIRAVFFDGDMALYGVTQNRRYLDPMLKVAEQNHWQPEARFRHADALAVGQLYCELYCLEKDPRMIAPLRERIDKIMAQPMPGREDWWWCDSLFMAPPTLARLSAATGDQKYLDFMDKQWWDATDFLYDKSEHLYYRDKKFFDKKEANGKKVFWSRGNGWVMAGIVRVLQDMPKGYPTRQRYVNLLSEMADRVAGLQQRDGFWRASLLDPDAYPGGETSGTALFCYAMCWGINQGILPRDKYLPVVRSAWRALTTAEDPSTGKIGWVQPVGAAPAGLKKDDTAEYGVGAFLLAGSEMLRLDEASASQARQ